jgi:hypothetical protein
MEELGNIGFLMIICFGLLVVAVFLAPLVDKALMNFNSSMSSAGDKRRVKEIARVGRGLTRANRNPNKYRDAQLDELIQARRLDEAGNLAAERLRLAHEQGLDDRVKFYRGYQQQIKAAKLGE